jgi:hypothetical protein
VYSAKSEPAPVSQLVLVDGIAVATGMDGESKEKGVFNERLKRIVTVCSNSGKEN